MTHGPHLEAFLRRREWFVKGSGQNVCWWIRNYMLPTIEEGERRLDELRRLGPTRTAFTLHNRFEAPA